ncbi:MAG TPA: patatin-like phospholipase family protein [Anaerolineae bacterium]|nr:patatin-like phospholipase family protein [Anaerolineae bacterium]HMR67992.1 patatin-like phospholipase family protein [Anaerolineae bacterium]
MKKYGLVASGGGYRSFYSAGVLVWLKQQGVPIVHLTSTSSGNNIVLDYLLWDWDKEELPPVLTKTFRLNLKDIFEVFANFLGLQPPLLPNGSHLFTVNKTMCRKSLHLDDPDRRQILARNLQAVKWDIMTTNLSQRRGELFNINEILAQIDDASLSRFMDVFIAGITAMPYFKAVKMNDDYYVEGGYTDNTPLRSLFADPEVDEIIAIDFTDFDYGAELDKLYGQNMLLLAGTSIDMNILVNDIQWGLPNRAILSEAILINKMLEKVKKTSLEIDGKTYYHKPLHILKPKNLESMTISLEHMTAQKDYFKLGQEEAGAALQAVLAS